MRKLKRIASLALAMVLCLALGVSAFADTNRTDAAATAADTGTITINGLTGSDGTALEDVTVTAYKIAEAVYDSDTGYFVKYQMVDACEGCRFSVDPYGGWAESSLSEENLAELFACVSGTVYRTAEASDGTATFEGMEVGSYLFVVSGSESTVFGMVIGSVYYDAAEGGWTAEGGIVDAAGSGVSGENVWVKSTTPSVEKTETGGSLGEGDFEHGGSADVGDTLEYHITVSGIPSYEGSYPEFIVTDVLDSNLRITEEEFAAMTVTVGEVTLESGTDYIAERTDSGFTVDFVVEGSYTLNDYVGQTLVIDFSADVVGAGDGTADDLDHPNTAVLTYATTSYVLSGDGSRYEGTGEDTDHEYTFNAKLLKTDQNGGVLSGAVFTLYTDEACQYPYTQDGENAVTAASGEDGTFEFTGLQEGIYYMKETAAPTGYALNTNVYRVEITAVYDGTDGDRTELMSYTVTVTDAGSSAVVGSAAVNLDDENERAAIMDTRVGSLPSMGASGTLLFCVIGAGVVLAAAVLVTVNRRRSGPEDE